jgi:hypothetical protein
MTVHLSGRILTSLTIVFNVIDSTPGSTQKSKKLGGSARFH